jgi:hypothetical protein
MHDTDERSMRELLARGAAGDEPPLGSLLNDVVRAGFRARRRRRIAGAGGALGAAVLLAAGITAGIGHAPWSGPRRRRPGGGGEGCGVMDGDPGQRSNGAALVPLRGPAGAAPGLDRPAGAHDREVRHAAAA